MKVMNLEVGCHCGTLIPSLLAALHVGFLGLALLINATTPTTGIVFLHLEAYKAYTSKDFRASGGFWVFGL